MNYNRNISVLFVVLGATTLSGCTLFDPDAVCTSTMGGNIGYNERDGKNIGVNYSKTCVKPAEEEGGQASLWQKMRNALHAYTQENISASDIAEFSLSVSSVGGVVAESDGTVTITLRDDFGVINQSSFEYSFSNGVVTAKYPENVAAWVSGYESLVTSFDVSIDDITISPTDDQVTIQATEYEAQTPVKTSYTTVNMGTSGGTCSHVVCRQ